MKLSLSYLSLFVILILITSDVSGQRQTFVGDDGTSVDLEVISTNPDEGRNASIFLGFFGPEGMHNIGANYYLPGKFFVNAMAGYTGFNIDGTICFTSGLKTTKFKQSVKQEGNTRYLVKIPGEKRRSLGLHVGTNSVDYTKMSDATANYKTQGLFTGLSFINTKHTHWKIFDAYKQAQGTSIARINADIIYYYKRDFIATADQTVDDVSRKIGYRIYVDGKATFWSRQGRLGFQYMLGVGLNSNRKGIPLFAGAGLGYSFL